MKKGTVKCEDCTYLNNGYTSVEERFIDPNEPNSSIVISGYTIVCTHDDCFDPQDVWDPTYGTQCKKVRIAGQAQLNKNGRCTRFKKRSIISEILFVTAMGIILLVGVLYCTFFIT